MQYTRYTSMHHTTGLQEGISYWGAEPNVTVVKQSFIIVYLYCWEVKVKGQQNVEGCTKFYLCWVEREVWGPSLVKILQMYNRQMLSPCMIASLVGSSMGHRWPSIMLMETMLGQRWADSSCYQGRAYFCHKITLRLMIIYNLFTESKIHTLLEKLYGEGVPSTFLTGPYKPKCLC